MIKSNKYIAVPILLFAFVIAAFSIIFSESLAIPAFARKYGLSCKICHDPFPRLNAYGEDFAGNGFPLPDKE